MKTGLTSPFGAGALWFGAAVSIAEIEAGCQIGDRWGAMLLGHLVGGLMLFAIGLAGAQGRQGAMASTARTFGRRGALLFASLNVCQLVGWTAVMIAQGAAVASPITEVAAACWCWPLAALVIVWMLCGGGGATRFGRLCTALLAILCVLLTARLVCAQGGAPAPGSVAPGFLAAFETSVALPLSWLPLIADYTKDAKRPTLVAAVSAATYSTVSAWMFALGILLVGAGYPDLIQGLVRMGHGYSGIGLLIVLISTMITTYFDVHSSGESASVIWPRLKPRPVGIAVALLGGALAAAGIMGRYLDFLGLIASVFSPMATVLIVDRYLVRKGRAVWNLLAALAGVLAYHAAGASPIGPTMTAVLTAAIVTFAQVISRPKHSAKRNAKTELAI